MAAKGIQFRWRWDRGTISTQLDVIWGMSAEEYHENVEIFKGEKAEKKKAREQTIKMSEEKNRGQGDEGDWMGT